MFDGNNLDNETRIYFGPRLLRTFHQLLCFFFQQISREHGYLHHMRTTSDGSEYHLGKESPTRRDLDFAKYTDVRRYCVSVLLYFITFSLLFY